MSKPSSNPAASQILGLLADLLSVGLWIGLIVMSRSNRFSRSGILGVLGLLVVWSVTTIWSRWRSVREAPPEERNLSRRVAIITTLMSVGGLLAVLFFLGPKLLGG